jgi:lactate dehydrogenase-like 2-hydroxyacid dehydrogenase
MKPRLICAAPLPAAVAQRAGAEFDAVLSQNKEMAIADLLRSLQGQAELEAVLISSRIKFDAATIAALPSQVKILATCSAGTEHIDLSAARTRGLIITNTPDVLTNATADLAFMLLLCASRRAREYMQIMDQGWRQRFGLGDMLGIEVSGGTLGILGMGRIGRAVAQRARAFGMKVLYHNRNRLPRDLEQGAVFYQDLNAMLPHCQFLSLHAPGGNGMDGIIDRDMLGLLPPRAVLVNTSRGQLLDENALIDALASGRLAAAGLDVFRSEPDYDLRLKNLPNVFLTPHMGSATVETRNAMGFRCLENIAAVLNGGVAPDQVS